MTDDSSYILDSAQTVCLCDVGLPGHLAGTAIEFDGTEHFVLVESESIGDMSVRYCGQCPEVEHEQLGELPPRWQLAVAAVPIRCGRPTAAGKPCRMVISGAPCRWHRHVTTERTAS